MVILQSVWYLWSSLVSGQDVSSLEITVERVKKKTNLCDKVKKQNKKEVQLTKSSLMKNLLLWFKRQIEGALFLRAAADFQLTSYAVPECSHTRVIHCKEKNIYNH